MAVVRELRYFSRCCRSFRRRAYLNGIIRAITCAAAPNVTAAVENRMTDSLRYAVAKSMRRGLKRLPVELEEYA